MDFFDRMKSVSRAMRRWITNQRVSRRRSGETRRSYQRRQSRCTSLIVHRQNAPIRGRELAARAPVDSSANVRCRIQAAIGVTSSHARTSRRCAERACKMLWWRYHAQAQAFRKTESGKKRMKQVERRDSAGSLPGDSQVGGKIMMRSRNGYELRVILSSCLLYGRRYRARSIVLRRRRPRMRMYLVDRIPSSFFPVISLCSCCAPS